MTIHDARLREHYDKTIGFAESIPLSCPVEERPVMALLDAYYRFAFTDGEESPVARECLQHLLSPELRPALRGWYRRFGDKMNSSAVEFRDRLSGLAGERFG